MCETFLCIIAIKESLCKLVENISNVNESVLITLSELSTPSAIYTVFT